MGILWDFQMGHVSRSGYFRIISLEFDVFVFLNWEWRFCDNFTWNQWDNSL